jgi:PAS domain S-box-containing protein
MSAKPKKRKRKSGAMKHATGPVDRTSSRKSKQTPISLEALYSELFDKVSIGVLIYRLEDRDDPLSLRLVGINATASRILRLAPKETLGKLLRDYSPNIFLTDLPNRYAEVARTGVPQDIDDFRYGNERMPEANYRLHLVPLANDCVGVSFEDITARVQAQETMQMLEELAPTIGDNYFRTLVSHLAPACQADLALVGQLDSLNDKQVKTIAVWHSNRLQINFTYPLEGSPCEFVLQQTGVYAKSGLTQLFPNNTFLSEQGFEFCLGISLQSSHGKNIGLVLLLYRQPLTQPEQAISILRVVAARASAELDRQMSEEALRASEEFLQMSQRAGNVGSWRWDLRTSAVQWSDSMFALYGLEKSDFDGTLAGATRTSHPDDIPLMTDAITKTISEGIGRAFEYRVIRNDGETGYLWSQSDVVSDESGKQTHVIGTVIDLTARRKMDAQIQHAQKLESLGVLAGGIAHDFNNILVSLVGYTDLAMRELPPDSSARPLIGEAVKAARRASELTKQMLAYSGRGQFVVEAVDLNAIIEDMESLLQVSISKKCVLQHRFMHNLPTVEADTAQMRQVVMNLIINAAEAIGDRVGTIELTTGTMHCDRKFLSSHYASDALTPGEYVFVEVADTGEGMSEDTRTRIFDPFFTTKFTGRGLGLAVVHGIVRGHRGMVTVKTELGRGTVFRVILPIGKARPITQQEVVRDPGPLTGSGGVLIVDDEEAIRSLAQRMLERLGFSTLTASDGIEAVELYRVRQHDIRLVLLDMTMPKLDGEETFDALRAIRADVRVILSSGYDEQSAVRRFAGKGLAGFLQKPYTYEQLANACKKAGGEA